MAVPVVLGCGHANRVPHVPLQFPRALNLDVNPIRSTVPLGRIRCSPHFGAARITWLRILAPPGREAVARRNVHRLDIQSARAPTPNSRPSPRANQALEETLP